MPDTFNRTQPRCEPLDTRRIKPLLTFGARRGESGAGMHNRPHTSQAMQQLPSSGPAREALREKGQFWTPAWLATVMASWVTAHGPRVLFDPAVGPGTFFAAARQAGFAGGFAGFELHGSALTGGCAPGLAAAELRHVTIGDFISSQLLRTFPAIVSNPPYIRHHRLSGKQKEELQTLAQRCLGFTLDGRAGLHLYFLLKCLDHLAPGGRLAFLLPADVCEGVSSRAVWGRLAARFRLDAVLMFEEPAAPFPAVDTNAMVFLFSNLAPRPRVPWLRVRKPDPAAVLQALDIAHNSIGLSKPYPRIFRDVDGKPGWNNTAPARTAALDNLQEAHTRGVFTTRDVALLAEFRTFIVNTMGKAEGAKGTHDDLTMGTAIAWVAVCRAQPRHHDDLPPL